MLRLVEPSFAYEPQVMAYKRAFLESGDEFDGCAGLESCGSYAEWLDFDRRLRQAYGEDYVPSKVYLAVREEDDTVVGIIDCRQRLSEFLLRFGGHIGYSVLPSQRCKGYAKEMLRQALETYWARGVERVLVTCDRENEASRRTILANGGQLENELPDEPGLGQSGWIQRYWITRRAEEK